MKILNVADTHDKAKNPVNRIDNYHQASLLKLDEVIEISQDCDFVLHTGDVWDSPFVSNSVIDDWLDRIEASGKIWYILPGNHDEIGGKWENSSSSALAHALKRSKNIRLLTHYDNHIEGQNYRVIIDGYAYYTGIEEDLRTKGLLHNHKLDEKENVFVIACTHAFITINPFLPQVTHIQAKDIQSNYHMVLCSHFHTVFDKTIRGTRYLNPGPFGRTSITEAHHTPQVIIIDTETQAAEIIELKSAKPAENIFDLSKIQELKTNDASIEEFIKSVESVNFQGTKIQDVILQIAKEQNIDKKIVEAIFQKIGEINE